ncbi:class I SAM-dependent DNA methyltransferase [Chimaeribacter arupi]|uniref:SAM-dependent methyltransferase n=1 Tax=Chimaeribacter arupi TaxID=2060066 RepID=A0A2N5EII0_9GAMM|nr:class I SAM-dependent methyltransferase [Chimaeribacter arupi]PLR44728.1 SAM-dependent methyltransferase [Chimaeribacter arupi]
MCHHPAADNIIPLYQQHAALWDAARRDDFIEQPWLDAFLSLLPARGSVLDIGCGAGKPLAAYLLARECEVTGVDASPPMIALCRARFPQQRWQVADMRTLALGRTFHGLLAWDSFFHLTREAQRRMFPIFRAHARPGAALLFTSGPAEGEAIGTFAGQPLYHASLSPAEYRQLLAQNGFRVVRQQTEDPTCGHHTLWLAQQQG